jgi:hypothetical protein
MTDHDKNLSDTPASRTASASDTPVTRANRDTAAVIIWRITVDTVDDAGAAGNPDAGDSPLTARLARHLVAIYSDVHDTVIDVDADSNLQHAAEATGRTYTTIAAVGGTGPQTTRPGPAALILLRWPRPGTDGAEPDATSLLRRCRQHLADEGSTIVVVTATPPGADRASYSDHEQVLLAAARTAGLRHLHDVVAIDAPDGRDAFTYATDRHTAEHTGSDATRQDAVTTLVIFGHPGRRP